LQGRDERSLRMRRALSEWPRAAYFCNPPKQVGDSHSDAAGILEKFIAAVRWTRIMKPRTVLAPSRRRMAAALPGVFSCEAAVMGKSQRLRHVDLRDAFLLLGECCELGADPVAWRRHMVEGLRRLLHAQVAIYQELQPAKPHGESGWLVPLLTVDVGWTTDGDRRALEQFWARGEHELCPWFSRRNFRRVFHPPRRLAAFSREGLVANAEWRRSEFFNDYVCRAYLDDMLLATYDSGSGATHGVVLHRASRDEPFGSRERQLLGLFFAEQAQLLGTRLACRNEMSVLEFPRRLREVLICLMEGDGEKQIAARLGVSPHTVHDYVKELYRRFGAAGRGKLLAQARPYWAALRLSIPAPTPKAGTKSLPKRDAS